MPAGSEDKTSTRATRDRGQRQKSYGENYGDDDMSSMNIKGEEFSYKIDLKELQAQEMAMAKFKKAHKKKQELEHAVANGFTNGSLKPDTTRRPSKGSGQRSDNKALHDLQATLPAWDFTAELHANMPHQILFPRQLPTFPPRNLMNGDMNDDACSRSFPWLQVKAKGGRKWAKDEHKKELQQNEADEQWAKWLRGSNSTATEGKPETVPSVPTGLAPVIQDGQGSYLCGLTGQVGLGLQFTPTLERPLVGLPGSYFSTSLNRAGQTCTLIRGGTKEHDSRTEHGQQNGVVIKPEPGMEGVTIKSEPGTEGFTVKTEPGAEGVTIKPEPGMKQEAGVKQERIDTRNGGTRLSPERAREEAEAAFAAEAGISRQEIISIRDEPADKGPDGMLQQLMRHRRQELLYLDKLRSDHIIACNRVQTNHYLSLKNMQRQRQRKAARQQYYQHAAARAAAAAQSAQAGGGEPAAASHPSHPPGTLRAAVVASVHGASTTAAGPGGGSSLPWPMCWGLPPKVLFSRKQPVWEVKRSEDAVMADAPVKNGSSGASDSSSRATKHQRGVEADEGTQQLQEHFMRQEQQLLQQQLRKQAAFDCASANQVASTGTGSALETGEGALARAGILVSTPQLLAARSPYRTSVENRLMKDCVTLNYDLHRKLHDPKAEKVKNEPGTSSKHAFDINAFDEVHAYHVYGLNDEDEGSGSDEEQHHGYYGQGKRTPITWMKTILPLAKQVAWSGLSANLRVEDEPVLRYIPYFGDEDTNPLDVSFYEDVSEVEQKAQGKFNEQKTIENEVEELVLMSVVDLHAEYTEVDAPTAQGGSSSGSASGDGQVVQPSPGIARAVEHQLRVGANSAFVAPGLTSVKAGQSASSAGVFTQQNTFVCEVCSRSFKTAASLSTHMGHHKRASHHRAGCTSKDDGEDCEEGEEGGAGDGAGEEDDGYAGTVFSLLEQVMGVKAQAIHEKVDGTDPKDPFAKQKEGLLVQWERRRRHSAVAAEHFDLRMQEGRAHGEGIEAGPNADGRTRKRKRGAINGHINGHTSAMNGTVRPSAAVGPSQLAPARPKPDLHCRLSKWYIDPASWLSEFIQSSSAASNKAGHTQGTEQQKQVAHQIALLQEEIRKVSSLAEPLWPARAAEAATAAAAAAAAAEVAAKAGGGTSTQAELSDSADVSSADAFVASLFASGEDDSNDSTAKVKKASAISPSLAGPATAVVVPPVEAPLASLGYGLRPHHRIPLRLRMGQLGVISESSFEVYGRDVKGLRGGATDYKGVNESYQKLFCRRCYTYDCRNHGHPQPMPVKRTEPRHSVRGQHARESVTGRAWCMEEVFTGFPSVEKVRFWAETMQAMSVSDTRSTPRDSVPTPVAAHAPTPTSNASTPGTGRGTPVPRVGTPPNSSSDRGNPSGSNSGNSGHVNGSSPLKQAQGRAQAARVEARTREVQVQALTAAQACGACCFRHAEQQEVEVESGEAGGSEDQLSLPTSPPRSEVVSEVKDVAELEAEKEGESEREAREAAQAAATVKVEAKMVTEGWSTLEKLLFRKSLAVFGSEFGVDANGFGCALMAGKKGSSSGNARSSPHGKSDSPRTGSPSSPFSPGSHSSGPSAIRLFARSDEGTTDVDARDAGVTCCNISLALQSRSCIEVWRVLRLTPWWRAVAKAKEEAIQEARRLRVRADELERLEKEASTAMEEVAAGASPTAGAAAAGVADGSSPGGSAAAAMALQKAGGVGASGHGAMSKKKRQKEKSKRKSLISKQAYSNMKKQETRQVYTSYVACSHEGACNERLNRGGVIVCICAHKQTFCEKFCGCDR
jgi:hypothetical protein